MNSYTRRAFLLGAASMAVLPGCQFLSRLPFMPNQQPDTPLQEKPASQFVSFLNRQAELIQSISYTDVSMSVGTGGIIEPSLSAELDCAKPRSFRMKGSHALQSGQVDLGSNDQFLWVYVRHAQQGMPNYMYARNDDLNSGRVKLPIPFDPDWVFMALGMSGVDSTAEPKVNLYTREREYHLSYTSRTPQGELVRKIVVFAGDEQAGNKPQVKQYIILNEQNNTPIAKADVYQVKRLRMTDPKTGSASEVVIPTQAKLTFTSPDKQKLTLDMTLRGETINPNYDQRQRDYLFTMPERISDKSPVNIAEFARGYTQARGQSPAGKRR
jgi:hypothetical protein